MKEAITRKFTDRDGSGHEYLVPVYSGNPREDMKAGHSLCLDFLRMKPDGTYAEGIIHEDVLAAVIDRLEKLNAKFYNDENAVAVMHLRTGLMWLEERTRDLIARDVEGKHEE